MVGLREERCAYLEAGHVCAATVYAIPIVSVTIANGVPHLRRARYRAPHDFGLETLVTLCLSGPASEALFCGPIEDGSDQGDLQMAREYLSRAIADPLQVAIELARYRAAAARLVGSVWAQQLIIKVGRALLRHDTLRGEQIFELT
jgi:hypothetical protein